LKQSLALFQVSNEIFEKMDEWTFHDVPPGEILDPKTIELKKKISMAFHFSILTITPWHFIFSWRAHLEGNTSYFYLFQVINQYEIECTGVIREQGLDSLPHQTAIKDFPAVMQFFPPNRTFKVKIRMTIEEIKLFISETSIHLLSKKTPP
jgi:hypothetical protein